MCIHTFLEGRPFLVVLLRPLLAPLWARFLVHRAELHHAHAVAARLRPGPAVVVQLADLVGVARVRPVDLVPRLFAVHLHHAIHHPVHCLVHVYESPHVILYYTMHRTVLVIVRVAMHHSATCTCHIVLITVHYIARYVVHIVDPR